jgi:hydrogenase-4 component E
LRLESFSPHDFGSSFGGVGGLVDGQAVLMVALAFGLVATRRLASAIWLLTFQSLGLAGISFAIAISTGALHVYAASVLTVLIKGVAVPLILTVVLKRLRIRREVEPVLPTRLALLVGVALVLVAYHAAGALGLPGVVSSRHALPVSLALILIGLFLMVGRRKALSQVIGLITMENGVYLAALVATYGLPLAVELGVFFDLLVGLLLMGVFVNRISDSFESINTDRLGSLKG